MTAPPRPLFGRCLTWVAVGLPLLVTAFAVVMAGSLLADGLGDVWARLVLRTVGGALLTLIAFDAIVLLSLLGLRAIGDDLPGTDFPATDSSPALDASPPPEGDADSSER